MSFDGGRNHKYEDTMPKSGNTGVLASSRLIANLIQSPTGQQLSSRKTFRNMIGLQN